MHKLCVPLVAFYIGVINRHRVTLLMYMNKMRYIITIIATAILAAVALTSCIEDDFTTSSNDTLEFSVDTLAFDTVLTEEGTATRRFTVYNRHKNMLNISSITLDGNTGGRFYVNVDGVSGDAFSNVEIRGEDSIFVFVEATLDPTGNDLPVEIEDMMRFVTNGVEQQVVITAWGQDVTRLHAPTIDTDTHLAGIKPYVIYDTMRVAEGVTLTLDAGTTLMFHDKAAMVVDGTLHALGEQGNEVNLRGDRLDNVVGGTDYDIMSGQWDGIRFTSTSTGNEMRYVYMRGSTSGVVVDSAGIGNRKLYLFNSVLHNATSSVLTSRHAWVDAVGCEFSDASGAVVSLTGGYSRFAQCTFANYYLFDVIRGAILTLDYLLPDDSDGSAPLMDAHFDNCVIYGNATEISPGDLTGSSVLVRNCLFGVSGSDDNNFINCVWEADPCFFTVREEYIFDYRLKNGSDAIGTGDPSLCPDEAVTDRYGINRFIRGNVDIGAYTWVEQEEDENTTAQ